MVATIRRWLATLTRATWGAAAMMRSTSRALASGSAASPGQSTAWLSGASGHNCGAPRRGPAPPRGARLPPRHPRPARAPRPVRDDELLVAAAGEWRVAPDIADA